MKTIPLSDFLKLCATSFEFDVAYEFDEETNHPTAIGYALSWDKASINLRPESDGRKISLYHLDWEVTRIGFRRSVQRAIIDIQRKDLR